YLHADKALYWLTTSIIFQYFLAGFVCGVCFGGIILVTKLIRQLDFKKEIQLDYFYPDKCAGTLIIGKVLFYFALYTIFIGLLIFLYIHKTHWLYEEDYLV